jgi:hypothetical protein
MKNISDIEPLSPEWFEAKVGKLSSSEIHKIFKGGRSKSELIGQGGQTYINLKIGEIMTGVIKETKETDIMMRGNALEPEARQRYSESTNQKVRDSFFVIYNSICCGTNDGGVDAANSILEIKCPNSEKHTQILTVASALDLLKIDDQYYHQCQANMMFGEADYCDFVSYDDRVRHHDLQIRIIRIYPDMEWRTDFNNRIEWVAEYMNDKFTEILKAPERNSVYRVTGQQTEIERLKEAVENMKEQLA